MILPYSRSEHLGEMKRAPRWYRVTTAKVIDNQDFASPATLCEGREFLQDRIGRGAPKLQEWQGPESSPLVVVWHHPVPPRSFDRSTPPSLPALGSDSNPSRAMRGEVQLAADQRDSWWPPPEPMSV